MTYTEKAVLQAGASFMEVFAATHTQVQTLLTNLRLARQIRRERHQLKRLPQHLLADIGIDPISAQIEANKYSLPEQRKAH